MVAGRVIVLDFVVSPQSFFLLGAWRRGAKPNRGGLADFSRREPNDRLLDLLCAPHHQFAFFFETSKMASTLAVGLGVATAAFLVSLPIPQSSTSLSRN